MDSQGMEALPPLALWGFDPIRFMSLFGWNFGISLSILFLCCFFNRILGGTEERTRCAGLCHERRHPSAAVVRQAAAPAATQ